MRIDYETERAGGVYSDRMLRKSQSIWQMPSTPESLKKEETEARLRGVDVTISPESMEYMEKVNERKEAAQKERERLQKEWEMQNPQNPFGRMGTQFSIISNALAEHGFYDNMSDDEVLEIENLLVNITHGMNSVCGTVKVLSPESEQLTSQAAKFELESSTAALRQFSQKYVSGEMQDFFNNLVDQYYEHNSKVLEGYQSSRETSNELLAAIYEKTASNRRAPLSENEKMIQMAGKVKVDEEDEKEAIKEWRKCLKALADGKGEVGEMMGRMSDILKMLASGNSENKQLLNYVEQWNSPAIENARKYWSVLV